jgi:hypothetical protein
LTGAIGAVQKAGTAYNTWKGKDIRASVNEEANAALKTTLRTSIPGAVRSNGGLNAIFPVLPTTSTTGAAALSQALGRPVTIIPPTR